MDLGRERSIQMYSLSILEREVTPQKQEDCITNLISRSSMARTRRCDPTHCDFLKHLRLLLLLSLLCLVKVKVKSLIRVRLFATPWTVAHQTPPSMGFSRQEYWSGLPFPSKGDLPKPGIEPRSPALQADALISEPLGKPCLIKQAIKYKPGGTG